MPALGYSKEKKMLTDWGKLNFNSELLQSLNSAHANHLLGVRVEKMKVSAEGTRGQKMSADFEVLAKSDSDTASLSHFSVSQYWAGKEFLKQGQTYIVLMVEQDADAKSFQILQWEPVSAADAKKRINDEAAKLAGLRAKTAK